MDLEYVKEINEAFKEENQANNWYRDFSEITLPLEMKDGTQVFNFTTSATSGSVSTSWFGQEYDHRKFRQKVDFKYTIVLPKNIDNRKTLRVEMKVDTKEISDGFEEIYFTPPGSENEGEIFKQSVNVTFVKEYKIDSTWRWFNKIVFSLIRVMDEHSMKLWNHKRMTGFSAKWYFTGQDGEKTNVNTKKLNLDKDSYNILFKTNIELPLRKKRAINLGGFDASNFDRSGVDTSSINLGSIDSSSIAGHLNHFTIDPEQFAFIDIYKSAVFCKGMTVEDFKQKGIEFRNTWTSKENSKKSSSCKDGKVKRELLEQYANGLRKMLTDLPDVMPLTECFKPLDKENLEAAYKMLVTVITCPASDYVPWKLFYTDLLTRFPPRVILQNAVNIFNKMLTKLERKRKVPELVLIELTKNLNLTYETLNNILDPQSLPQKTNHMKFADGGKHLGKFM